MADDRRGLDATRFDACRPELDGVKCLDLNWGHGLNEEGRNFGVTYLYSIGNTGHRYVAACTIPGIAPEEYPIAIVDEGGYTVDVFASSITTWLPCYLLRTAEFYLDTALHRNTSRRPIPWLDDEVERLLSEEGALRGVLREFGSPAADDALTVVLALLRHNDTLTVSQWRPAELYTAIEPDGYVSAYRRLAASSGTTLADWTALIRRYPRYNKPLFHQFADPAREPSVELAHEVLHRRLAHDADGVFDTDVLDSAARLITRLGYQPDPPLGPLVRDVAEGGAADIMLGEAYFEAGQRWEEFAPDSVEQALVCYENAIHQHAMETDEWHWAALSRLRELSAGLGDDDYQYYLDDALADVVED